MANNFRTLIVSFILIGLFFFAFVNFAIQFPGDNNSNQSLLENEAINSSFENYKVNVSSSETTAKDQRDNFESDIPDRPLGDFLLPTIISGGTVFTSALMGMFNITVNLFGITLRISNVIIAGFVSILLITIIFWAWRTYKTGD